MRSAPAHLRRPVPARLGPRAAAGLALLALVPYLNGLAAGFTFDDEVAVRDNPHLASPARVVEVFTTNHFGGPLAGGKNYRPVVGLTYALQRWTTGAAPFPFHAVNLALHVAVTLAFAAWLLALEMPRAPSLAAAALFAVVPIHVEAVTGVVGRAELLVALLVLASAFLFRRATDGATLRALPWTGALAAFLLALFTKENAVVLPGVVALGELVRRDTVEPLAGRLRRKALPALGFLVPLLAFAAVRLFALGGIVSQGEAFFELDNPLAPMPGLLRAGNGAALLLRYAAKTLVPVGLSADHSAHALDLAASPWDARAVAGFSGVALIAAIGTAAWRRLPLVSLGAGLFLGAFLPTSNLLVPIGTIYAERLAYLPSAGLLAAVAGLLAAVPGLSRDFLRALLAVALATDSAGTVARNVVFHDDDRLFSDMLEKVPRSARARYNVAWVAWGRGEAKVARASLGKAIALFPRYYDAWQLLGLVEAREGRFEAARAALRESLRINPPYERGWVALARIEQESGRPEAAERAAREGLRRFPGSFALLERRARLLAARGRLDEARPAWEAAIAASGGSASARLGLARTLSAAGRDADALVEARRAIAALPGWVEPRIFLAERLEARGNPVAAAAEIARAARAAPRDPVPARRLLELAVRAPAARGIASTALPAIEGAFGRPARNLALREAAAAFRAATGESRGGGRAGG